MSNYAPLTCIRQENSWIFLDILLHFPMPSPQKQPSAQAQEFGRRGGRAPKRPLKFTITELAEAAGKSVDAVRKDRQRGKFDQKSLRSVAQYILSAKAS
jgi:hypothetical protein